MLTKLVKDIIGAVFMALGVSGTILLAVTAAFMALEDATGSEFTLVPKKDKTEKK